MKGRTNRIPTHVALLLGLAVPALAQFGQVDGYVSGPDNKPIQGAVIGFDKLDATNHFEGTSDKKGYFTLSGVPVGDYAITVTVNGQVRERRSQYHVSPGRQQNTIGNSALGLNFKLKPAEVVAAETAKAEVKESKDGGASKAKVREEELKKNQLITDSFNAAKAELANQQWDQAIEDLNKAAAADPKQAPVWAAMADAWIGKSSKQKGDDAAASYAKASEAFSKAVELLPTDAGFYNNYALSLAGIDKLDEANAKLAKAIELDPQGAGKYYYNLGVLLLNRGQANPAVEQFKKAIEAEPNYAEAHFQYATALLGKATTDASGKIQAPDAVNELRKYLQLKPNGPNAVAAKEMLNTLGVKN